MAAFSRDLAVSCLVAQLFLVTGFRIKPRPQTLKPLSQYTPRLCYLRQVIELSMFPSSQLMYIEIIRPIVSGLPGVFLRKRRYTKPERRICVY